MIKNTFVNFVLLCVAQCVLAQTGEIRGTVIEKSTGEPMPGTTILIESLSGVGTTAGSDGNYSLNVAPGIYTVKVSFVAFNTVELTDIKVEAGKTTEANIAMAEAGLGIEELVVTAVRRMNSEVSMINAVKTSNLVLSGVSSQQIGKTQDRDASEVVKRIPGVSIIDSRFIIARGLSQRYNNVWVNNNAVPSSEADSRAFSFDMIPSGQIENMMIVKSPAPELPADFTGGFVKIATKSIPEENTLQASYGININTLTHFRDFIYSKGSSTDFLGYDNGFRDMRSVVPSQRMDGRDTELVTKVTQNGFNNDWKIHSRKPITDHRFSLSLNRHKRLRNGGRLGMLAAVNYSCSYLTYTDMVNARFGTYDRKGDTPVYLYDYNDDQYTTTAKLGAMLNLIWAPSRNHRFEFRNIFNQQGRDRHTYRDGWQNVSAYYDQIKEEYLYSSRGTYTGQLSGFHTFPEASGLDWTVGYSYADKNQPDRRQVDFDGVRESKVLNSILRDFIRLDENTTSVAVNYNRTFSFGTFTPMLKTGAYAEYGTRAYNTRSFSYKYNVFNLPEGFISGNITEMMRPEYFSAAKFYISDATNKTNDYSGENLRASGYLGINLPLGKFNVYAGGRYEHNKMTLHNYVTITSDEEEKFNYPSTDFFPSVNATYHINKTNLIRLAYGKTINRQEFREVSPSVYYDFDLFSYVRGNKDLKQAYIQNVDLRYEIYPSGGEMISFAVFYKKFKNPIEWTFIDSGGSYTFTFENARQAVSYGAELDVKKSLDFIGLPDLSLSFNGAIIHSNVEFDGKSLEHDRPMQGQSPYIVNAGLFYQREKASAGLMYNIIGKRIVGIGRVDNSQGGSIDNDIPDMFEMPRHAIDLSLSYKLSKLFELSAGVRDLLAAPLEYKQFPRFTNGEGKISKREQTTKKYKMGQNLSATLKLNL